MSGNRPAGVWKGQEWGPNGVECQPNVPMEMPQLSGDRGGGGGVAVMGQGECPSNV